MQLELDAPPQVGWWRVVLNPIFAIPLVVWGAVLAIPLVLVTVVAWLSILSTGTYPRELFKFSVGVLRYYWRVTSFALCFHDRYPPFAVAMRTLDANRQPPQLSIYYPRRMNRLMAFTKWLMVIPSLVLLLGAFVPGVVLAYVGVLMVIVRGRWPGGIRRYLVGVNRWALRVVAYVIFLTDCYPGFRF